MTHICVNKLTITGLNNGLSPGRRQAIIWTNAGILLIRTLGTNFRKIRSKIHAFSFKKMHLKMSSAKWRLFCLGLNVLREKACFFFPHSRGLIELFLPKFWVKQWSGRMFYTTASSHTTASRQEIIRTNAGILLIGLWEQTSMFFLRNSNVLRQED